MRDTTRLLRGPINPDGGSSILFGLLASQNLREFKAWTIGIISSAYSPIEKGLRTLTPGPDIIIDMQIVPISMPRVNSFEPVLQCQLLSLPVLR